MSNDHKWLNLIEVSGPFLAVPVLRDVFPQGLETLPPGRPQRLRRTYEEWRVAVDMDDLDLSELHMAWIDDVLLTALEMDATMLRKGAALSERLTVSMPEHGVTVTPDLAVVNPTNSDETLLIIHVYEPDTDLEATYRFDGLSITLAERMVALLRATECPTGIITNGERWMLVHAPVGAVAGFASWYARLWGQEPETLRAFVSLLGVRRFFGPDEDKLPALYERSLKHQDDVTEALGEQVRRAVEVLIQALDRADQDRNRELLRDVDPRELYEAGLTIMMRLVFLLSAEERGLLLLGDPRYDSFYAISSLRMQLRTNSEDILERRRSAWSRLLALFRGVYGGIEHPTLRLPALGGSLFDPDRYPFLEGRKKATSWCSDPAAPLPIDDRTVLLLLEAIQTFEGRTLSYRALDVEQIGHVYEGLLERTVKRVDDVTLELDSGRQVRNPRVTLGEVESARLDGTAKVVELLKRRGERSKSAINNALERPADDRLAARLLTVCRGETSLRDRILPYAFLLRTDPWGYPLVHHKDAFVVVRGTVRRESGAHYTPESLTRKIVEETLTPVAYHGPAEGKAFVDWELKSAEELLNLKVCDPAMGSGAFLVQACRWLSDRLVEAWSATEADGKRIDSDGRLVESANTGDFDPLSQDAEERAILARRLIAERCLYGVDMNPLAVELAKLSLWLTTMSNGRPFGFLDHNLRNGDCLFGIHDLRQLAELNITPKGSKQLRLFGRTIHSAVNRALELRTRLRDIPVRDIHDVKAMAALDARSRDELELPEIVADALVGIILSADGAGNRSAKITTLAAAADEAAAGDTKAQSRISALAASDLANEIHGGASRRPLHWPLAFPEVFSRDNGGFDAFVGNPPFLGGQRITGVMGTVYRNWLVNQIAGGRRGSADLVAYFFLRVYTLLRNEGNFGLIAVNTISEGDTRQVGLEAMLRNGAIIHSAYPNEPWPGKAAVVTSRVHIRKGIWNGRRHLQRQPVAHISAFLSDREEWSPKRLKNNQGISFIGSYVLGTGFVLTQGDADRMLDSDPKNSDVIFPYLTGKDLNTDPEQRPSRWVINFWDWPQERACEYTEPWRWVEEKVKPERQTNARMTTAKKWWQFGKKRLSLYHAIGRGAVFKNHPRQYKNYKIKQNIVIVCSLVSKYLFMVRVQNEFIYAHRLAVFSINSEANLAFLQSSVHESWARKNSSSLENRMNYAPSDAFETLPFPLNMKTLGSLGGNYESYRCELCQTFEIGLTSLYNRVHSFEDKDQRIAQLRELHREIDIGVACAYGWDDLDLGHGFHEVPYLAENDRVRFTIAEPARLEVLRRLAELNRQRYQEEVEQGSHGETAGAVKARRRRSRTAVASEPALDL